MNYTHFRIVLTNGKVNNTYMIDAMSEEQAIILAQAKAIKSARGYKLVSVEEL